MKLVKYSIHIDASSQKIWDILWSEKTYSYWTSVFQEGSYAESTWEEGADIRFLSSNCNGMFSTIEIMQAPVKMSFKHLGEIKENIAQPIDSNSEWFGSHETYTLSETADGTLLEVEVDLIDSFLDFFNVVMPKALEIIKFLSEQAEKRLTVQATIAATMDDVWKKWTSPEYVCLWNAASPEWHTPRAENDLRINGTFDYRMEAKDGSFGFNLKGTYIGVQENQLLDYILEDDRKVGVLFSDLGKTIIITQSFEPETENPHEMQQFGWQAILNNFKKHCQSN